MSDVDRIEGEAKERKERWFDGKKADTLFHEAEAAVDELIAMVKARDEQVHVLRHTNQKLDSGEADMLRAGEQLAEQRDEARANGIELLERVAEAQAIADQLAEAMPSVAVMVGDNNEAAALCAGEVITALNAYEKRSWK